MVILIVMMNVTECQLLEMCSSLWQQCIAVFQWNIQSICVYCAVYFCIVQCISVYCAVYFCILQCISVYCAAEYTVYLCVVQCISIAVPGSDRDSIGVTGRQRSYTALVQNTLQGIVL